MRVVLDTNILVSTTMWDNSVSNKLVKSLAEKNIEIFTSYKILEEYEDVLKRDFGYEEEEINKIVLELLSYIQVIEPTTEIEVVLEDPDDNKVIECAVDSNSGFIISYDNHLLNIREFRGIRILTPEEFLGVLKKIDN